MIVQIAEIARLLLILWIAVLCVKIALGLYRSRNLVDITEVGNAMKRVVSRKTYFLRCVLLFLAVYACIHFVKAEMIPQLIVGLTYEEAAKGQTPNKLRLNESDILAPDIMEKVVEKGKLNISAEELAKCFVLNSYFDEKKIDEETPESDLKIATEYRVVFSNRIYRHWLSPRRVMRLLADVYEEEFQHLYVENDSILNLRFDALEDMEYLDIADYLELQAGKLRRYLEKYAGEDSAVSEKIQTFVDVDLERYHSYVLQKGLFKKNEECATRMEHTNRMLQLQYDKDIAAYNVRMEMMNMYNPHMTDYVLVPTRDQNGEFYMSRTKVGVDYFADEANGFSQNANDLLGKIENNKYIIQQLDASAAPSEYEEAENQIKKLTDALEVLSEECRESCRSFFEEKRNRYGNGYLHLNVIEIAQEFVVATIFRGTLIFVVVLCVYLIASELGKANQKPNLKVTDREDENG